MMMLAKIRIVAACVAAAVVAGAIVAPFAMSALAEGAEGTEGGPEKLAGSGKVINPWGEVASPLVREVMKKYGIEHGEVKFREEGAWIFGSENSAVVAMETTLRTDAVLEYGESTRYGAKLADDGLHYIHIFHLKGLEPDTAYHVRMTCTDRWGKKAASKDLTVRTKTIANAVRIPGDLNGPPYELGQANAYYLVTEDISTPRTAFNFSASNVTLDLGAHTITYNEEHMDLPTNSYNNQRKQSAFGARIWGRGVAKARVVNGTIAQGKGNDKSTYTGIGFNPIYCTATGSEIAGVTCIYSGQQMCGIHMHSGNAHSLHHNIIHDKGRRIFDRHKSVAGIKMFGGENHKVYNNLIKLARQVAIGGGAKNSEFNNNEVHVVSYSVNGGGVGSKASVVHDNKIFGCGCNVVASAATGGTSTKFYRNYVWLHAHDLSKIRNFFNRGETGGVLQSSDVSIMSCARITWGCNGPRFRENTYLATARDGGLIRGTFFYADDKARDAVFHDNLVIAITEDAKTDGWGAIAGVGNPRKNPLPIVFRNNTIVSNFANFNMLDSYGCSANYRFAGNTFVKVGDRPGYLTIRGGLRGGNGSKGHVFIDSEFEGGAGYDKVKTAGSFTVQWTLALRAPAGADVSIEDKLGNEVFAGKVGPDGRLAVPLSQYRQAGGKKTEMTPHTVTAKANGRETSKSVTADAKKELELVF